MVRKTVSESLFCEMCVSFLESKWQSDASHCDQLEGEMRKCDFLLKRSVEKTNVMTFQNFTVLLFIEMLISDDLPFGKRNC